MENPVKIQTVAENRYAPEGANQVQLYAFNGQYEMTLPELVMAICLRKCGSIESQGVIVMNKINETALWLETLALLVEDLTYRRDLTSVFDVSRTDYVPTKLNGNSCTYQNFLIYEVGLTCSIPNMLGSVNEQLDLIKKLEDPMNAATTNNQEQTIELQSVISRRDSSYNTSASMIKKLGTTMQAVAANF